MSLLLDTRLVLWAAIAPARLSPAVRAAIDDPATDIWFSVASLWEIAIKAARRRADFDVDPRRLRRGLLDHDWRELAITGAHALALDDLPPLHKDPFDRMLLAQAKTEGLTLLTADALVAQYPGKVRKV
ncbi:MAG: type II toxin-antitoxin system VapC family toxin [Amphiplicatus sp.]